MLLGFVMQLLLPCSTFTAWRPLALTTLNIHGAYQD